MEPRSRGVLGPPVKPEDDERGAVPHREFPHAFFFTSLMLEKTMPSARSLV